MSTEYVLACPKCKRSHGFFDDGWMNGTRWTDPDASANILRFIAWHMVNCDYRELRVVKQDDAFEEMKCDQYEGDQLYERHDAEMPEHFIAQMAAVNVGAAADTPLIESSDADPGQRK